MSVRRLHTNNPSASTAIRNVALAEQLLNAGGLPWEEARRQAVATRARKSKQSCARCGLRTACRPMSSLRSGCRP